jgi:class 3 adenylate cyclase
MGRFYRQVRETIERHGGLVDKFMGDGVLFYWMPQASGPTLGATIDDCIRELVGTALNVADEWQDEIDHSVKPIGLRAGAAIGRVLFVQEDSPGAPVHAIGDCINLANRLQGAARPNTALVSNRTKVQHFDGIALKELPAKRLKNIGAIIAWERDYEAPGAGGV